MLFAANKDWLGTKESNRCNVMAASTKPAYGHIVLTEWAIDAITIQLVQVETSALKNV